MAGKTTRAHRSTAHGSRRGRAVLGTAVGTAALLAGGLPLLGAALPTGQAVPDGAEVRVGAGGGQVASVSFGPGWTLDLAQSTRDRTHLFTRGAVRARLTAVDPVPGADAPEELWAGLRDIMRVGDPSARLGEPRPVANSGGARGLTGALRTDSSSGAAGVFRAPNGAFAVELVVAGSGGAAPDEIAEAEELIRTVDFTEGEAP